MKKRSKIMMAFYNCFCFLVLVFSLILAFKISKDIYLQRKLLQKQKSELNYLTTINKEINNSNINLKTIESKIKEKNKLNDDLNLLIDEENQLDVEINNLNSINKNLEDKIKVYE